jgi:FKBP-type peptidyl-prolyl cis-trans isomerase 2
MVKNGDEIIIKYELKVHNKIVESDDESLFTIGDQRQLKGVYNFLKSLIGKKDIKGLKKNLVLTSEEAYGNRKENLILNIPKDLFKLDEEDIQEGSKIAITLQNGHESPGVIVEVADTHYTIDCNHPLCDTDLHMELEIIDIH